MLTVMLAGTALVLVTWWAATTHAARGARRGPSAVGRQLQPVQAALEEPIAHFGEHEPEPEAAVPNIAAVVREGLLELRNAELRLILDAVDQGFVTVQPDGQLLPERSKILEQWTGELPVRAYIWDVVERLDPSAHAWTKHAWLQLQEGFLPLPLALSQLPSRLQRDGRCWDMSCYPVSKSEALQRVVVVLTDVSAALERQRALAEQGDFAVLVERLIGFRHGYFEFWNEATRLVASVSSSQAAGPELRRNLHTLKGSSRFVGLLGLAAVCHELEDATHEREPYRLTDSERERLRAAWDALRQRMQPLLQTARGSVEFAEDDFKRLERAIHEQAPHERLQLLLQRLLLPSTAARLAAAKQHLLEVCQRLGKSPPEVTLLDHDLRLSSARFANFWSVFVHVLNNTADHGVESDAVRLSSGKSLPAKVQISTRRSADSVLVEVSDDGPGIDWSRVAARARQRNLPFRTRQELVNALFSDAFSLSDDISEFSGRGVGLAAVKSAVSALGGSIEVESELGRGTKMCFRLALDDKPTTAPTERL